MADAVHFLTVNDTVTPANSSGCNGFPTPYVDYDALTAPEKEYYPELNAFTDLIKWYWRVKNWTVATDLTVDGNALAGGTLAIVSGASRERDLLYPDQALVFNLANGFFDLTFAFFVAPTLTSIPAIGREAAGDLRLGLQFYGTYDDGAGNSVDFSSVATAVSPVTDSIIINLDNGAQLYALNYKIIAGTPAVVNTFFLLDPVLFWPYAALDTTPIYNTTTGAQLQDPRN